MTCTSLPPTGVANPIDRTLTSLLSLQDSRAAQCCTACDFAGLTLDRRFTAGMYFQQLALLGRRCPGTAMSDARLHRCRHLHAYEELYMHAALSHHSSCTESEAVSLSAYQHVKQDVKHFSLCNLLLLLLACPGLGPLQDCQP